MAKESKTLIGALLTPSLVTTLPMGRLVKFCTKSLVKIGEDQTIEAPEGSPWAEWAKQHDSRQTSVRILGRGYSELAKEKSHEG